MTENTKKVSAIGVASIFSLFLVSMAFSVVTPAMATLAEHFAGKDVSWFSTLPTLFIVIGTFVAGQLMGKRMSYRALAILGSLISLIFGCAPALFDNYMMALVCRGAFGFGMGLLAPLGNALIIGLFEGQKQASFLGYGTLFMNGGGIALQMLGGVLAAKSWNLTFWGHAFILVALIMALFLPEPPKVVVKKESGPKEKIAPVIWGIAILLLVYNILNFPIMMNLSVLFVMREAGGATVAATALSLYTISGCVAGFLFGQIFKVLKRFVIGIGFIICALGALFVYIGANAPIMTAGTIFLGFGFSLIMPACMSWAGMKSAPSTVAAATALVLAFTNLGGFVSSFWLQLMNLLFKDTVLMPILIEIIVFFVLAVVFLIYSPFKKAPQ